MTVKDRLQRKYVFGPVHSRRLGYSLGVDLTPPKTCPLDCIYCEVGRTTHLTIDRAEYVPAKEVLAEIRRTVAEEPPLDYITFSGSGEPTLHSRLGSLIRAVRRYTGVPVAVLTNGVLLSRNDVRSDLMGAHVILPSLDAATGEVFARINRPYGTLKVNEVIDGLIRFRREFRGEIWLEVLFVRGVNDNPAEVSALAAAIQRIGPDKVQIHTVTRPSAEPDVVPLHLDELKAIQQQFGDRCEVIWSAVEDHPQPGSEEMERKILLAVSDRAGTITDIAARLSVHTEEIVRIVDLLVSRKALYGKWENGVRIYRLTQSSTPEPARVFHTG